MIGPIRWKFVLFLPVLGFLVYVFVGGEGGFYQLWQRWRDLETAEAHVARLQAENDSLRQVLHQLENDLKYVEKVAREEYGMVMPGEQLYRLRRPRAEGSED